MFGNYWPLIVLLVLVISRCEPTIVHIPLDVEVILVGFESKMDALRDGSSLQEAMREALSFIVSGESRNIALEVTYHARSGGNTLPSMLDEYRRLLEESQVDSEGYHIVTEDKLLWFWSQQAEAHTHGLRATFMHLPVIVVHSDNLPKHRLIRGATGSAVQAFSGDMLFLDLTAPVDDNESGRAAAESQLRTETDMLSTIIMHVGAAVQQLGLGSLQLRQTYFAETVVLPVILFRSVDMLNAEALQADQQALQTWAEGLVLPHQRVSVVTATHFTSEFPQVSVALALSEYTRVYKRSMGTHTLHFPEDVHFLDPTQLATELAHIGDRVLTHLLSRAGHYEAANIASSRSLAAAELRRSSGEQRDGSSDVHFFKPSHGAKDTAGRIEQGMAVVPVVALGDVDRRRNRLGQTVTDTQSQVHVLPLLNGTDMVQYVEERDVVLALHSSAPSVLMHSSRHETWREVPKSPLAAVMMAAVSDAVTALRFRGTSGDGNDRDALFHWPTWALPSVDPTTRSSPPLVLSWAARRTTFAARVHEALRVSSRVQRSAQSRLRQTSEAMHVALGLSTSDENLGALSDLLPSTCAMHVVLLEDAMLEMTQKVTELQRAIRQAKASGDSHGGSDLDAMHSPMVALRALENAVHTSARTILSEGRVLRTQFGACLVELTFDLEDNGDPSLAPATGPTPPSSSSSSPPPAKKGLSAALLATDVRQQVEHEARVAKAHMLAASPASMLWKTLVLFGLLAALYYLRHLQIHMGRTAKKML